MSPRLFRLPRRNRKRSLLKVFVLLDMLGCVYKCKARVIAATIAWRELLPKHASYLVLPGVLSVMGHAINTGPFDCVARFVFFGHYRLRQERLGIRARVEENP
jgi:hypothetical protein